MHNLLLHFVFSLSIETIMIRTLPSQISTLASILDLRNSTFRAMPLWSPSLRLTLSPATIMIDSYFSPNQNSTLAWVLEL